MKITIIDELDVPNKNGHVYTKDSIEKTIEKSNKNLLGTIGMPSGSTIQLSEVSHRVNNLRIEDNKLVGDMTILNTPKGIQLKEMMTKDFIAFRSAGIGKLCSSDGTKDYTVIDFELISINAIDKETAA